MSATAALREVAESAGPVDAVITALAGPDPSGPSVDGWQSVLADHHGILERLHVDAAWARAVVEYAAGADRPVQLVALTDARTSGGRSRAQSSAQLARVAASGTQERVTAFSLSIEAPEDEVASASGELVGYLLANPEATALAGAELVIGPGWIGLRSHPRPIGTVTYGGPAIPSWLDASLREVVAPTGQASRESR